MTLDQLLDASAELFNIMWPVFAIVVGFGLGMRLVGIIHEEVYSEFGGPTGRKAKDKRKPKLEEESEAGYWCESCGERLTLLKRKNDGTQLWDCPGCGGLFEIDIWTWEEALLLEELEEVKHL